MSLTNTRKAGGAWKETRHDKFYHLAKEQGYRSRAAFKLIQLNKKFDFLSGCKSIVDLGAAPGGWLQVAQKYMPVSSLIIGLDLLPIRPLRGVTTLQADITTEMAKKQIKQELQTWDVDVVLHDGAPNVAGGGSWVKDAYIQNELVVHSLRLATTVLRQGGWFITKIFRSQDYNALLWVLQQFFKKVEVTKPQASRNASAEIFAVCQGYLAPKKIDAKLLDPNLIFEAFDSGEQARKKTDVFAKQTQKRNRAGYDDVNNMTQTNKLSAVQWVSKEMDTTAAIAALGDNNAFTFDAAPASMDAAAAAKHDAVLAVIQSPSLTSSEVRELCGDLKVLGKGDFKSLLKWRKRVQDHLAKLEEEAKKTDGRWEAEQAAASERAEAALAEAQAVPVLSAEEQFSADLRELRAKQALDAKKEKKKKREAKAKAGKRQLVNAHNLAESSELVGSDGGAAGGAGGEGATGGAEDSLFTLRTIKNRSQLELVAETEGKGHGDKSKKKRKAADDDGEEEEGEEGEDEDGASALSDDELYAEILAQREAEHAEATGKSKKAGVPRNIYEDQEQQLLAQIRSRDAKRRAMGLDPEARQETPQTLENVRGGEAAEQSYYEKLEQDLDFMYETYRERRQIKAKNRTGGSELDMAGESAGADLLRQARKEEKAKLKAQAASRKRKREAGDSDTDDEDDMDRFNSDDAEESDTDGEDAPDEETLGAKVPAAAADDDASDDGDASANPLLRRLHREEAPSNALRMKRWMQRGLLADADLDGERKQQAEDDEALTAQAERRATAAAARAKAAPQSQARKQRALVEIGGEEDGGSSSEDDAAADVDMAGSDADSDAEGASSAAKYFSGGKAVRTKSGLKPNSVLGLDGLKRSVQSVHDDVLREEPKKGAAATKRARKAQGKAPAAPAVDDEGDAVDSLKAAEQKARASLKKTTKNYKAAEKARSQGEKEKNEAFEEVPAAEEAAEPEQLSSDDDAVAERLALGRHMLAKKSRDALINDSYSRYSQDREELSQLPEWFVRDEAQHHTPILPVSKAEVDQFKEQLRAINARPIRKIAEAKARKQVKTEKRWEKIKAQAEVIANAEGGNGGEKLRQIEKLFHQKSLKKEKKERVYVVTLKNGKTATPKSSSGRKGKIVKVDSRQKKDKRGAKKAAQRNKSKDKARNSRKKQKTSA